MCGGPVVGDVSAGAAHENQIHERMGDNDYYGRLRHLQLQYGNVESTLTGYRCTARNWNRCMWNGRSNYRLHPSHVDWHHRADPRERGTVARVMDRVACLERHRSHCTRYIGDRPSIVDRDGTPSRTRTLDWSVLPSDRLQRWPIHRLDLVMLSMTSSSVE